MSQSGCVGGGHRPHLRPPWPVLPRGCFSRLLLAMTLIEDSISHVGMAVDGRQCRIWLLPVSAARGRRRRHENSLSARPFPTALRHFSSAFRIFEPGLQLANDVHQPDSETRRRRRQSAFV